LPRLAENFADRQSFSYILSVVVVSETVRNHPDLSSQEDAAAADVKASVPRTTIRTKKTQMNYASQDCGAKILSHNPEARVGVVCDSGRGL